MFAFLGPLLGGLGGLLFPAAAGAGAAAAGGAAATGIGALLSKAMLPALGAGLGTLATGGNGKDAIRNALLMGGATALFPGMAQGIQESGFGKKVTGGIADLLGMAGGGPEAQGSAPAPAAPAPMQRPPVQERRSDIFEGGARPEGPAAGMPAAPSTLPSLSEMSAGTGSRMMERAASGFGQFGAPPPPQASDLQTAMEELGPMSPVRRPSDDWILGAEGFDRRSYQFPLGYAQGGEIEGPGTGTSDSIPAMIYQDGKPVSKAALSDGEFVMTADAVKGAGNGSRERGISRMYELMRRFERGEMA